MPFAGLEARQAASRGPRARELSCSSDFAFFFTFSRSFSTRDSATTRSATQELLDDAREVGRGVGRRARVGVGVGREGAQDDDVAVGLAQRGEQPRALLVVGLGLVPGGRPGGSQSSRPAGVYFFGLEHLAHALEARVVHLDDLDVRLGLERAGRGRGRACRRRR